MSEREIIRMANPVPNAGSNGGAVKRDEVVLYAEHRSVVPVLGEYGGDSYPASYRKIGGDGKEYGMMAVADGVGSGGFVHKSLINYLSDEPTEKGKLRKFLTAIFGEAFLSDREAVDYAVKNFAPLPPDGFYSTATEKAQIASPFYTRASQYIASRIACVAVFYKFRDFFADKDVSEETAAALRKEMVEYYDGVSDENGELITEGELRKNLKKIFDISDGVQPKDRDHYYLPTTFSCWFYKDTEKSVKAVSINIGDSRCYKVDGIDGVLQISTDDANPVDNSLTRMIRYGTGRHVTEEGAHDCLFNAVTVEVGKPCALFCCTDGVYDTCQNVKGSNYKAGLPFDSASPFTEYDGVVESCDVAFEYNFFNALRACKSVEDVRQFTARSIYLHRDPEKFVQGGAIGEYTEAGQFGVIKQDDSATMAMRFFSEKEGYPEILSLLADEDKAKKTSIVRLFDKLTEKNAAGDRYCYKGPAADKDPSALKDKRLSEYATREPLAGKLTALITEDSQKAVDGGKSKMWGAPCNSVIKAFSAKMYFKSNSVKIFKLLSEDMKIFDAIDKSLIIPPEAIAEINEKYKIWFDARDEVQNVHEKVISLKGEIDIINPLLGNLIGTRATGSNKDLFKKDGQVFAILSKSKNFFSGDFKKYIEDKGVKRSEYLAKCSEFVDDVDKLYTLFDGIIDRYETLVGEIKKSVDELKEKQTNSEAESKLLEEKLKKAEEDVSVAVERVGIDEVTKRWKEAASCEGDPPCVLLDVSASDSLVPKGWSYDEHVVYSIDRYLDIDKIVREDLGAKSFTAYRDVIDKEIGAATGAEYYEKAKRSYEEFSKISTAVFDDDGGRFAVRTAHERGINK